MSLTTCLKKAGAALSAEDKADILAAAATYRKQGMKAKQAAMQAVKDQLDGISTRLRATMARGGQDDQTALPVPAGQGAPGGANAGRVGSAAAAFVRRAAVDRGAGRAEYNPAFEPAEPEVADAFEPVAQAVAKALGTRPVALVRSKELAADGVHWAGESLVNVEGLEKPATYVAIHESTHELQARARRARKQGDNASEQDRQALEVWDRMERAIWSMVPAAERARFAQEALGKGLDDKTKAEVRDEFLADFTAKRLTDPETLAELARREPTRFGEFARLVIDSIEKVIAALTGSNPELGARDTDQYIKDLKRAKQLWVDAMVEWQAGQAPAAEQATPRASGRSASPVRQAKIDEAAAAAIEGGVPEYAVQDAAELVAKYPGAPEVQVPAADRARLEAAIAPLIDRAKALQLGFKAQVEALAERLKAKPKVPGVKGLKRAAEKMYQEELENPDKSFEAGWLKDLVRGSIVVEAMDDVPAAIEAVREVFTVTRIKDRFSKPTEAGYRDVLMNVDLGGMTAELQIHIPEMLAAKELGHLLYEVERTLPNGDEKALLQEAQAKFYGAAFDAATGAEPAFSRRATSAKNSSREMTSSSSSFSSTTPETADLGDSPGSRTTGNSSLAKNLVPSGSDVKSITETSDSDQSSDPSIVNRGSQPRWSARSIKDHKMLVEREERATIKTVKLSTAESALIDSSAEKIATQTGTSLRAVKAAIKAELTRKKAAYPVSKGWAPLNFKGAQVATDEDGKPLLDEDGKPVMELAYDTVPYNFHVGASGKNDTKTEGIRVEAMAMRLKKAAMDLVSRRDKGDAAAEVMLRQAGWYKNMRQRLRSEFGGFGDFVADLLGATSPNTPVRTNWEFTIEALRMASSGAYDDIMPAIGEWWTKYTAARDAADSYLAAQLAAGKKKVEVEGKKKTGGGWEREPDPVYAELRAAESEAAKYTGPEPRRENGKRYGINTNNVLSALGDLWRVVEKDTAPKARNFSGNLIGFRTGATIDVWAARLLRRLANEVISKGDFPRVPPPAEKGVGGKHLTQDSIGGEFGFGQAVFNKASEMLRRSGVEEYKAIGDDDLQAIVWFLEKELWTKNNWTTVAGEGGSFEQEADLAGSMERDTIKELRRIIDSSKSSPEMRDAARRELAKYEGTLQRFTGGLSIQQSTENQGVDSVPTDAEMAAVRQELESAAAAPEVVAFRAFPTIGRYGADERSFDVEGVTRMGYDLAPLHTKMREVAKRRSQDSFFTAKALQPGDEVDLTLHRPGIEIFFSQPVELAKAGPLLAQLREKGVEFFTFITDGRRTSEALAGAMPKVTGVRMIALPEFMARYGDAEAAALADADDAQVVSYMQQREDELRALRNKVDGIPGVSYAEVGHYEVNAEFKEQYDGNEAGTPQGNAGQVGGQGWSGLTVREGLARANPRDGAASATGLQDGAGSVRGNDGQPERQRAGDEPPRFSGRSDAARGGRDRGVPEGSEQGSPSYGVARPGAAAPVEAVHFSQQQRSSLSSAAYGSGLRGAEMERVMRSSDARLRQRAYFYVNQGTGIRPESGVGAHAHRVTLNNLYDTAKGEIKGAGNEFESAVLDAGYDGYLVRLPGTQSGQAVLLGAHNVPVEYLGLGAPAKTQPAPASQAAAALSRKVGGDLVTTKDADVAAIRALAQVKEVAPSFRFEFGKARVKADEAAAAAEALEEAGSTVRFSRRSIVSPQSALDEAIRLAEADLRQAIDGNKPATLGRASHVLAMLGAGARPLRMDAAVVQKVFVEKHAGKLAGIPLGDIVRGLYRPALVFKQQGKPNEYELVLPVVTERGPLTAAVVVDGAEARVKSIYPRSWKMPESGPGLAEFMANGAASKPVYADEYLAAIAVTGNEDARAEAGIRNRAGSPNDLRPGVTDLGDARQTSPAQTPDGSGTKNVARPGAPVNQEHFMGWSAYRALAKKFGKLKDERDLLRWIGDNYDGEPSDAPAFSGRIGKSLTERLNDAKAIELPTGYLVGDYLKSSGKISWWHKTVGTMHDLAAREPLFRPVYNLAQRFIADISTWATKAADLAPNLLPKLERLRDITKSPLSADDTKALAVPVFQGTLSWTRDWSGAPIKMETAEGKASRLSVEEKARVMIRNGALSPQVYKMWMGMKVDQHDSMVNARYAKMALKPGVVWSDAELRTMFNLNDRQIGLYREFRRATDESLRSLSVSDMVRFGGKDLAEVAEQAMAAPTVEEARDILVRHLDTKIAAEPDRADVLTDTAAKVIAKADQARDLMKRGYAPLQRFGRYTVDVLSADGERLYFSMFETEREANKRAREMQQEFPAATVKQGTMSQQQFQVFAGISPETAELFGEMMGLEANGMGQGDKAFQQWLKLAKSNRSAMKRLIERKGIAGFSEDVGRVLATFVYSNARQTSKNLNFGPMSQAVMAISEEKGEGEILDAAVGLQQYVSNPQEEAAALRGLLFTQFLGGSIAAGLVNMVQPIQVTFPYLTQWGGVAKAASRMRKALARTVAWESGTKTTGNKDLDKAIKEAEDDGTISPQEVHQLIAQAGGAGSLRTGDGTRAGDLQAKASNLLSKVMLVWGKPFAAAEQFNRRATFIAAWETATQEGLDNPAEFARKAIQDTQFVYNKGNRPQWARGAVGATLFTFKIYSISFVELAARLAKNGPEGKRSALVMLGMLVLIGGLQGIPGADDLDDVIDGLMQRLGYNWSTADRKQEIVKAAFGDALGEFVLNGLSGLPGAPIDVSNRLGLGNLIPGTGLLTKKEDYGRDVMEILGPAGSLASQVMTAAGKLVEGEFAQAGKAVAPVAAANLIKGLDMASMGMYRDKDGRKVIDTDGMDAIAKAIGFQPRDVAKVQEAATVQNRLIATNKMRESEIADKWAQGIFESDADKVRDAKDELKRWNASNPTMRIEIDNAQVVRRLRQMRMTRAERLAKTAPAQIRRTVQEELSR